jgi:hypothetical protein
MRTEIGYVCPARFCPGAPAAAVMRYNFSGDRAIAVRLTACDL